MDPKACLERARDAINDRDYEAASDALQDYADWRRKGGFEDHDDAARRMIHVCRMHGFASEVDF